MMKMTEMNLEEIYIDALNFTEEFKEGGNKENLHSEEYVNRFTI
jgi:hypothetical protein